MSKADKILKKTQEKQPQLTPYQELYKKDWVRIFEAEMDTDRAKFDHDGNFMTIQKLSKNVPWIHNRYLAAEKPMNNCTKAHTYFSQQMNFIHSECHNCWKVVALLNTVEDLMNMEKLQRTMNRQAKCGIEARGYVSRLYGAYFYNKTLEEGYECLKYVRGIVPEGVKVILKRGCTEFEMKYGPSDQWKIIEGQKAYEKEFEGLYSEDIGPNIDLPEHLRSHLKIRWLHWASDHFDATVLKYTGGQWLAQGIYNREFIKPYLFPQNRYVTYEEEKK